MPMLKQPITEADIPPPPPNEGEINVRAALIEAEESFKKYGYSPQTIRDIWEEAKKVPIRKNTN